MYECICVYPTLHPNSHLPTSHHKHCLLFCFAFRMHTLLLLLLMVHLHLHECTCSRFGSILHSLPPLPLLSFVHLFAPHSFMAVLVNMWILNKYAHFFFSSPFLLFFFMFILVHVECCSATSTSKSTLHKI